MLRLLLSNGADWSDNILAEFTLGPDIAWTEATTHRLGADNPLSIALLATLHGFLHPEPLGEKTDHTEGNTAIAEQSNFQPWHTGGGCMALGVSLDPDDTDADTLLVSHDGAYIDGDPNAEIWMSGRYSMDGDHWDGDWEPPTRTLVAALEFAWTIPPIIRAEIGKTYRLAQDVERYPHFIASKGWLVTVTEIDKDDGTIWARMCHPLKGAEEWDNMIQWHTHTPENPACFDFARDVEEVEVTPPMIVKYRCDGEVDRAASTLAALFKDFTVGDLPAEQIAEIAREMKECGFYSGAHDCGRFTIVRLDAADADALQENAS